MLRSSTNAKHETVMDVSAQRVARVYAQALLGAAAAASQLDDVVEAVDALVHDVLEPHPGLERVLTSALITAEDKERTLERVFGGRVSKILMSFLKVLARHGRLDLLREVKRELWTLYNKHHNRLQVEVRVARDLDEATLEDVRRAITAKISAEPILTVKVDPELIAGLVIRVGDKVYDASVATRFRRAKDAMVQRAIELIQTRREQLISK